MSSRQLQNAIENPTLELKIISASNVSHIDATDKIDIYAVVSINGDTTLKKQSAKTPIDYDGGSNPTWNHTVKFSVNEGEANNLKSESLLTLKVKLYSYWLEDENDLYMGEVNVSVHELLASNPLPSFANGNVNKMKSVTYPVKFIGEPKPNAMLSLSYRFKPVPVNDLYPPPPAHDHLPPVSQPVYSNPDPARSGQPIIYSSQLMTTSQTTTVTKLAMELMIKSANDIKNVNVFEDMDVYALVMIREGKKTRDKTKTPIAYSGFRFPTWNHAVKFSFDEEELAGDDRLTLVVELMSHRPFMGDKPIGEVKVRVQELIGSRPPSSLTEVDVNEMKLVKHEVTGPYGEKGTLSFTYRFLEEQVTVPIAPQPFIMYIPIPHQSYGSANPGHGTSGYMAVHQGANVGPSNDLVPIYMPPPQYQPHGYHQPQLPPHKLLSQPQPQHQQEPQLQPPPPQRPTQSEAQTQGTRPQVKPQGGSLATIGLGAAVLGRVIGGALMSEMMSDEVNIYEVEA